MATRSSAAFIRWLDEWYAELEALDLKRELHNPQCAAICSADLVNGFCREGNLASPQVAAIIPPIALLFQRAYALGVRNFVLVQDTHSEHASEFRAFPPHCVRGTHEAETVDELRNLAFADKFVIVKKNSLHPAIGTEMNRWLDNHQDLDTVIVVGDCTDLCTYQLAMHLKLRSDSRDHICRVLVPANAVATYDLPVAAAIKAGAMPHDSALLHRLFLYHMALNGVQVVKQIV